MRASLEGTNGLEELTGGPHATRVKFFSVVVPFTLATVLGIACSLSKSGSSATASPSFVQNAVSPSVPIEPRAMPYRGGGTQLGKLILEIERHLGQDFPDGARRALHLLGPAVSAITSLSPRQKALEKALLAYWIARVDAGQAKSDGNKERLRDMLLKQLGVLSDVLIRFKDVIESIERGDYLFRIHGIKRELAEIQRIFGHR